jgi:hypothetical protein
MGFEYFQRLLSGQDLGILRYMLMQRVVCFAFCFEESRVRGIR